MRNTSSTYDKINGTTNELVGRGRQAVGKAIGDNEMQAKGLVQEAKGKVQQVKGEAKDTVKKMIDKA